jgi:putative NADPH-quinone reductase
VRALLVHAHPRAESYGAALRDAAARGLAAGGHEVDVLDLHVDGFEPRLSRAEWADHRTAGAARAADVQDHGARLQAASALVLVYPTWWGGPPAILKGWFERVWVEGVAYTLPPGAARVRPLLRNLRRLVVVTTHGSPKRINVVEGEPGKHLVGRQLRALCHPLARTRWLALYGMDTAAEAERRAFLARVERRLARPRL